MVSRCGARGASGGTPYTPTGSAHSQSPTPTPDMANDDVTIPAGEAIPAPPAGHAWMRLSGGRWGIRLRPVEWPTGAPDPTPPPGCVWIRRTIGDVDVYSPLTQPFLRGY